MPTLKTTTNGEQFRREAKNYVINMLEEKRTLHKKGCCQFSGFYAKYYDFDTEEDATASGIAFTPCELCFKE